MPLETEDRLIRWLRRRFAERGRLIGDDAALVAGRGPWAVSVDHQVAGVHFPPDLDLRVVGRRLVGVALSDLAAVGARPVYVLLALALPPAIDPRRLFEGLLAGCRRHDLELAGGDLSRAERLTASLTVLGTRVAGGRWLKRDGARPGDRIWVAGTLGDSAAGRLLVARGARIEGRSVRLPARLRLSRPLAAAARRAVRRHLEPEPLLEIGAWLARRPRAAAIDVSDGLALDLSRLCRAAGVGAALEEARLPGAAGFTELARRLGREPLALALAGGEDYALLFTLPPRTRPPAAFGCRAIGRVTPGAELTLEGPRGRRPLEPAGWDHLARPSGRAATSS